MKNNGGCHYYAVYSPALYTSVQYKVKDFFITVIVLLAIKHVNVLFAHSVRLIIHRGNFLSNVSGQLWTILPSTGNHVRHRAHDQSKLFRYKFVTHSEWERAQAKLLKNVPVYHQHKHFSLQYTLSFHLIICVNNPLQCKLYNEFLKGRFLGCHNHGYIYRSIPHLTTPYMLMRPPS